MPDIIGSTTFRVADTVTAASKALPPASRISSPAWVASGCAVLTIPRVPTAGADAVLRLPGESGCAISPPAVNAIPASAIMVCLHVMALVPRLFDAGQLDHPMWPATLGHKLLYYSDLRHRCELPAKFRESHTPGLLALPPQLTWQRRLAM